MEDSDSVEVVQDTLSEVEMPGVEIDDVNLGLRLLLGGDNKVKNKVGEAEVHRVETDVSKSGVESSTGA